MSRLLTAFFVSCVVIAGCSKEPASRQQAPAKAASTEVRIAAAASLKPVLPEILVAFASAQPQITTTPTYGASGNFHAQLVNGAPFDVFLSADMMYPEKLAEAKLTTAAAREYATGRLVIWARRDSGLDVKSLEVLKDGRVKKIAIANPQHAPYGRAAEASLRAAGVYDVIHAKLVLGENVEQAATYARTGAAEVGLLPKSQAVAPPMSDDGIAADVDPKLHEPIRHGAVVMKTAKDAAAAQKFVDFLTGPDGQAIFARAGLGPGR
jgi:molybdate transport system substrate-binding protein